AHFGGEVLPAGEAVLTRDHELRVTLRHRHINMSQVLARTRDGLGVTGGDVAREFLCLFAKGLERRGGRKRTRRGQCRLLSSLACTPLKTRLKEGPHTTQTTQVGVFPCRGLVAPCLRAPGSIKGRRVDVNRRCSASFVDE